jgi:hypothetical protein
LILHKKSKKMCQISKKIWKIKWWILVSLVRENAKIS